MKYLLSFFSALVFLGLGLFVVGNDLRAELIGAGVGTLVVLTIVEGGYDLYIHFGRFKLLLLCKWYGLQGKYIRFSMSYQYRIKINDRYLLVKNRTWDHFQHVGGKYKRIPETQKVLEGFEATDDQRLETTGLTKDDLAVFVPAKNAIKFLNWFNSGKDREVSHWREFYEELIDVKGSFLSVQNFPYVNYKFVCSVLTPLKSAAGWECLEILQYDVLDLIPTEAQRIELEELQAKGDSECLKWADHELIQCLGHDKRSRKLLYRIGRHTKWVVNLCWVKD